jgi:hypothetical protein
MVYPFRQACERESSTPSDLGRLSVCLSAVAGVEPGDAFAEAQR